MTRGLWNGGHFNQIDAVEPGLFLCTSINVGEHNVLLNYRQYPASLKPTALCPPLRQGARCLFSQNYPFQYYF